MIASCPGRRRGRRARAAEDPPELSDSDDVDTGLTPRALPAAISSASGGGQQCTRRCRRRRGARSACARLRARRRSAAGSRSRAAPRASSSRRRRSVDAPLAAGPPRAAFDARGARCAEIGGEAAGGVERRRSWRGWCWVGREGPLQAGSASSYCVFSLKTCDAAAHSLGRLALGFNHVIDVLQANLRAFRVIPPVDNRLALRAPAIVR